MSTATGPEKESRSSRPTSGSPRKSQTIPSKGFASVRLADIAPKSRTSPLLWNLPEGSVDDDRQTLINSLWNFVRRPKKSVCEDLLDQSEAWLAESDGQPATVSLGAESLAWCHALPAMAEFASPQQWWDLLNRLVEMSGDSFGILLEDNPLAHQLLAAELPLALGTLFPKIAACRKLAGVAKRSVCDAIDDLLDGEGCPEARRLPILRPLLACWIRCGLLSKSGGKSCFDKEAELQVGWMVRQALRLTRHDGTQMLTDDVAGAANKDLFLAALRFSDDEEDEGIADFVLTGRGKRTVDEDDLPEAAEESEWSELAVLRPNWKRDGQRLAVSHTDGRIRMELNCGNDVLFSGDCTPQVVLNGKEVVFDDQWEQACWFSDEDVDYLELEIELDEERSIFRHIMLGRKDQICFVADAVLGKDGDTIEYRHLLPMSEKIALAPEGETREGILSGNKPRALALPLALPEWRAGSAAGNMAMTEEGLELTQTGTSRLFAPLLLDLRPSQFKHERTWRQLTVAENLETCTPDAAVGFRIHVGTKQWLIYRSLVEKANRTVLGQNLFSEFLVARFLTSGDVQNMVEIE